MEKVKKILLILIVLVLVCAIGWVSVNFVLSKVDKKANPIVTMEFEGYGIVKIELYPDMAPNTVKNFIKLAERGFYTGKTFTDIEDGLIRGGLTETENSDGTVELEGPKLSNLQDLTDEEKDKSYSIAGEFIENGFNGNTLSHQKGTLSMYRKTYNDYQQEMAMVQMMGYSNYVETLLDELYNSQNAGFFITTEDKTSLDGTYTAFGRVVEGMNVIENISKIELKKNTADDGTETVTTKPVNSPVIKSVSVEKYGVDYGMPEVIDSFDFDAIFSIFMQNYMQSSGTSTTLN